MESKDERFKVSQRSIRLHVSVDQYRQFRREGFLVVRSVLSESEVSELREHTESLMAGQLPEQISMALLRDLSREAGDSCQELVTPPSSLSRDERLQFFNRLHMLHRKLALHEQYLLHPRVLDVLEVLIGSDILALSTMLFIKPPGKPGQGWHQDSFYLPIYPDTLCGAWMAIDDCDEDNGALVIAAGSCAEPVYPPLAGYGFGDKLIDGIRHISGASDSDENNDLAAIAERYPHEAVTLSAGDVIFFSGHVLHRSTANITKDRLRRSFVGHYCSARSFVRWGSDQSPDDVHAAPVVDPLTGMTNASHILARGITHLPFRKPQFVNAQSAASK